MVRPREPPPPRSPGLPLWVKSSPCCSSFSLTLWNVLLSGSEVETLAWLRPSGVALDLLDEQLRMTP